MANVLCVVQHETRRYCRSRVGHGDCVGVTGSTSRLAGDQKELLLKVNKTLTYSRIPIHERVELPESWIPADSRVEIDAKITAGKLSCLTSSLRANSLTIALLTIPPSNLGYFTTGHRMTAEELSAVQGRLWEE